MFAGNIRSLFCDRKSGFVNKFVLTLKLTPQLLFYQRRFSSVVSFSDESNRAWSKNEFQEYYISYTIFFLNILNWRTTTAQLHSTKPELRFCAGSNPARGVSEIRDGEDLWQWSRLEIRLNTFRRSTIPQNNSSSLSSSSLLWKYITFRRARIFLTFKHCSLFKELKDF